MKARNYFSILLFLHIFNFSAGIAQVPSYFLRATCFGCNFSGPNSFNFSIYFGSHDSTYFEFSGGQYSFEVDTNIANGGTLTWQILSSGLPANVQPRNPTVIRDKKRFVLTLDRNDFPGPGNGFNMSRRAVYSAIVRVTTTAPTIGGFWDNNFVWRNSAVDSAHSTRIFAYINSVNTEITTPFTHVMDLIYPIELSYFQSSVNGNIIKLNWETTSELNNSGFDIERFEINSTPESWKKISFVNGNGTSTSPMYYTFIDRNLNTGKYKYRLKQIDYNGNFEYYNLSAEVEVRIPNEYKLSQNYPNPFNPNTNITFELPAAGNVTLNVFDINGKKIFSQADQFRAAGYYTVKFYGDNLPGGIYFYKITAGNFSATKKMILIK